MEKFFSDLEGLRMAMEIENRGFNFYQQAYNKFKDEKAKSLFKMLMEEEQQHLNTFSTYFKRVEAHKEAHSTEYLFDADTSRYLTVLVESHVFPPAHEAADTINRLDTVDNIIKLALGAEKDSILLYDELAKYAKFAEAKEVFLTLKAEEQQHVVELSNKFKQLLAD